MKKLLFTFLFISAFFSAQNRFIYDYKFVTDSTNRDDVKSELMYLDISSKKSKFYSYTSFKSDSLMRVDLEKQLKSTGAINIKLDSRKGEVRYSVTKDFENSKMYLHNRIGRDAFKVLEDRYIEWKIFSDRQKIGEFTTQKATTEFAGRKWTAWFTEEIPINEGPYKFKNLPGLIVKLEDDTQSHLFMLLAIKNLGNLEPESSAFEIKNEIEINRKEYKKIFIENRNDPTKGMKQISMENGVILNMNNDADTQKFMKEREEKLKEAIKKNNNLIELDLLK